MIVNFDRLQHSDKKKHTNALQQASKLDFGAYLIGKLIF